ncbi:hypothetical protein GGX14DRAFT_576502 [Mycena pura]|uniref:SH3 domain-containing protein n=1 Tax=Mycena pura TaxID=153505 RepID=A0AAD6UTM9_9AGAR|nr:hypothetical protein GGX14DRAFT_576502 [Mycena pura]
MDVYNILRQMRDGRPAWPELDAYFPRSRTDYGRLCLAPHRGRNDEGIFTSAFATGIRGFITRHSPTYHCITLGEGGSILMTAIAAVGVILVCQRPLSLSRRSLASRRTRASPACGSSALRGSTALGPDRPVDAAPAAELRDRHLRLRGGAPLHDPAELDRLHEYRQRGLAIAVPRISADLAHEAVLRGRTLRIPPQQADMQDGDHLRQRGHVEALLCNYFYAATILVSAAAWLVAFVAQIAVTEIDGHDAVGVLWFAIFLQLLLTLGVLAAAASGAMAAHRLQLTAGAAAGMVLAALGVDRNIFVAQPARGALAAGWLVLAAADGAWLLACGAEPGTPLARLVDAMARAHAAPSADAETAGVPSPSAGGGKASFYAGEARSDGSPGEPKGMHETDGSPGEPKGVRETDGATPGISMDWTGMGRAWIVDRSAVEEEGRSEEEEAGEREGALGRAPVLSLSPPPPSRARRAAFVEQEPRQLSTIHDDADEEATSADRDSQPRDPFLYTVRAKSDWIPRSSSEVSFRKGDILQSAEKDGRRWWQVRKADGTVGSAPSNYLKVLHR